MILSSGVDIIPHIKKTKGSTCPPSIIRDKLKSEFGSFAIGDIQQYAISRRHSFVSFWTTAAGKYSMLGTLALHCFGIAVSEACCERGFAKLEHILTSRRNQLDDVRLESLVFLNTVDSKATVDNPFVDTPPLDAEVSVRLLDWFSHGECSKNVEKALALKKKDVVAITFIDPKTLQPVGYLATLVSRNVKDGTWSVIWHHDAENTEVWDPEKDHQWTKIVGIPEDARRVGEKAKR